MKKYLIAVPLLVLLAVSLWYAYGLWTSVEGSDLPAGAYAAMAFGIVFSVIVGCGLMALLFYSSRHGYDEDAQFADPTRERDVGPPRSPLSPPGP